MRKSNKESNKNLRVDVFIGLPIQIHNFIIEFSEVKIKEPEVTYNVFVKEIIAFLLARVLQRNL